MAAEPFAWASDEKLLLRVAPDAPLALRGAVTLRCLRGAAAVHGHVLRHNQTVLAHATSPALVLRYERAGDETVEDAPAWLCDHVVVEVTAAANQQLAVTEAPDVVGVVRFEGVAVAPVPASTGTSSPRMTLRCTRLTG